MSTRVKLSMFLIAVALAAFPIAIWLIRAGKDQSQWRPEEQILRQAIEETVETLEGETLEQLVSGLKDAETYEFPGVRSMDFSPQNQFEWVFSSRRTLKLIAHLAKLSPKEARRQADAICEEMFAVHEAAVRRGMDHREDPAAPKNTQSLVSSQLGQCCALVFLARFSDAKTVLARLNHMAEFSAECAARVSRSDAYPKFYLRNMDGYYEPDNAFRLDVLAYAIECDETISASTKESLREELAKLHEKKVALTAWDAEVTPYEMAFRIKGSGVNSSGETTTLIIHEWPFEYDDAKQREMIERVASLIGTHSP